MAEDLAAQCVRDVIVKGGHDLSDEELRSIPLIAATCGLLHDIGNPPFGHAGELAMSSWFSDHFASDETFLSALGGQKSQMVQDFLTFEGNAQGIRTVSNMHLLADEYGLNFTAATLSAACKYIARSHELSKAQHEKTKPGFFASEEAIVHRVRTLTGTADCRHPIAYLVEAADDIVYCSVDLEDSVKRGLLAWPDVQRALLNESGQADIVKLTIRDAMHHIARAGLKGRAKNDELVQAFRIAAISRMVIAARKIFVRRYASIMNGTYHEEILADKDCEAAPFIRACKVVLRTHVYTSSDVLRLEVRGRKVIHELLDLFLEGVSSYERGKEPTTRTYGGKLYLLFSDNYRRTFQKRLQKRKENELYCRLQLVTDQIAGMTDTYACRLHKDLTNG